MENFFHFRHSNAWNTIVYFFFRRCFAWIFFLFFIDTSESYKAIVFSTKCKFTTSNRVWMSFSINIERVSTRHIRPTHFTYRFRGDLIFIRCKLRVWEREAKQRIDREGEDEAKGTSVEILYVVCSVVYTVPQDTHMDGFYVTIYWIPIIPTDSTRSYQLKYPWNTHTATLSLA